MMPAYRWQYETLRWVGLGLVVVGVVLSVLGTGGRRRARRGPGPGRWRAVHRVDRPVVEPRRRHRTGDPRPGRPPRLAGRRRPDGLRRRREQRSAGRAGAQRDPLGPGARGGAGAQGLPAPVPAQSTAARPAVVGEPTPTPTVAATRGARGFPVPPFAVEGGAVRIGQVEDEDAWWALCGAAMGDSDCLAWGVVASVECDLDLTISFADTETGPIARTEVRSVRVRPGTPAFIASVGEESWSSIDAAGCRPRPVIDDHVATWFPTLDHEAQPEGCWDLGCVGFDVIPGRDCARADVQFAVYDDYGATGNPHDLVIPVELHEDVPPHRLGGRRREFRGRRRPHPDLLPG
ncbi:hypothetical protein [Curtobacterium sp. MCJR17_043]|uniref:hypothetical protein n=1 Tax=Curtobacterium sp. MCJR17_043 TaxID=2175660 RepID=UPI0024DFF0EC|nr:hypothetical protein [Curtobacterium sp. MCJR17_043]WIB36119.1 hypothetical protein DEJ15_02425 [Curtobacterium sp. MCJR17_043]